MSNKSRLSDKKISTILRGSTALKKSPSSSRPSPRDQIDALCVGIQANETQLQTTYIKGVSEYKKQADSVKNKLPPLKEKLAQAQARQKQARLQWKAKQTIVHQNRVMKAQSTVQGLKEKIAALKATQHQIKGHLNQLAAEYRYVVAKEKVVAKFRQSWEASLRKKMKRASKKSVKQERQRKLSTPDQDATTGIETN